MIPLYDFNIVCCALAALSAAVGYRYSRRCAERRPGSTRTFDLQLTRKFPFRRDSRGSEASADVSMAFESDASESSSDCPTPSECLADVTEPGSLKRKTREDDTDNYADEDSALASAPPRRSSSPPRKRCRTPTAAETRADGSIVVEMEDPGSDRVATPHEPPLAEASTENESQDAEKPTQAQAPAASSIEDASRECVTSSQLTAPASSTLPSSFCIPVCKPSSAFSAFAGTSTGFGSAFAPSTGLQRPVWCSGTPAEESRSSAAIENAEKTQIGQSQEVPASVAVMGVSAASGFGDAPTALAAHAHATSTYVGLTGEEDEEAVSDLKGVKLFVKRGTTDFATGMLGHVKLLSRKDTKEVRLVFRREPVWKVSMSVRLRPAVLCNFDEEHGILRLTLKEPVHQGDKSSADATQQVVVYALTKGKSSRADFAQFARSVAGSSQLGDLPTEAALI